jgi:hypothetical protein
LSDIDSTMGTGTFEIMLEEYAASAKMGYGYDPYATVPNSPSTTATSRKADLRRLSEWIRTKKHVQQLKESDEDPLP